MHRMLLIAGTILATATLLPARLAAQDERLTAKEMSALLEKARAKYDVPGLAAGIVHVGEKSRVASVGVRKRGVATKVTIDDHWHIGSNTKPVTAFMIAQLIDADLLDWDTPLEKIFPEHAGKWAADLKKVTAAHLITHTSGLPVLGPLKQFMATPSPKTPQQDRAQVMRELAGVELSAAPGEQYKYSNLGYVVLGAIIDRRGKASWEDQFKKRFCAALGIKHASLGTLYPGAVPVQPFPHLAEGKPIPTTGVIDNPALENCTSRVRMSVGDYCLYLGETMKLARGEKGVLKPATAKKLFSNPYPVSTHTLGGWSSNRKVAGGKNLMLAHEGSNVLNYCTVLFAIDDNLAVCVLTNQGGPGAAGAKVCIEVRDDLGRREKR